MRKCEKDNGRRGKRIILEREGELCRRKKKKVEERRRKKKKKKKGKEKGEKVKKRKGTKGERKKEKEERKGKKRGKIASPRITKIRKKCEKSGYVTGYVFRDRGVTFIEKIFRGEKWEDSLSCFSFSVCFK